MAYPDFLCGRDLRYRDHFPMERIGTTGSPFVLTFAKIGITAAAAIINFVVLTAALSGCNSGMYSCGRMLYALSQNKQLPAVMGKVSRVGVPVAGVAVSIVILLIGSCLNYIIPNPQRVFVYVYSASVLPGMVPWFVILISQLRFRQAHKSDRQPSVPLHSVPVCELFDDGVPDLRINWNVL